MKKQTIRKMDAIGRIVIPSEMRGALELFSGDDVEITLENGALILKKAKEENT